MDPDKSVNHPALSMAIKGSFYLSYMGTERRCRQMVRARGPSKGANWLFRERGLSPRFTTACAKLFDERGNPWLTNREQDQEFPLNRSRPGDTPPTAEQLRREAIYENARAKLEAQGVAVPKPIKRPLQPSLVVDPELDQFTKAERVKAKPKYVDPKGQPVVKDHARWRANLLRKTRLAIAAATIDVKDKPRKREKIRGGFYVFDAPVKSKRR